MHDRSTLGDAKWLVTLVLACGPQVAPEAPRSATIEPSPEPKAAVRPPLGQGDAEAERCLSQPARCTVGSASCAQRCREHELDACHRLATELDDTCRDHLHELACRERHGPSCGDLAGALRDIDPGRARELFEMACQQGHAESCTALGLWLAELGDDRAEAVTFLEDGCQRGDGEGCTEAGRHYNFGAGVDRDVDRGAQLLQRGCGLGYAPGCLDLAAAHIAGQGVPRDEDRAIELLEGVCSLPESDTGGAGCYLLGDFLRGRTGTPLGGPARAAFERACDKGNFDGCVVVAGALFVEERHEEAAKLADRLVDEQPQSFNARETRGLARLMLGRFEESAHDLKILADLRPDWPYAPLLLWVAETRASRDGAPGLEAARDRIGSDWPAPIADFLLGRTSEADLFRAATHPVDRTQREQQCEAFYYAAQRHRAAGRKAAARRLFERTVATGVTDFIEYLGAKAELAP